MTYFTRKFKYIKNWNKDKYYEVLLKDLTTMKHSLVSECIAELLRQGEIYKVHERHYKFIDNGKDIYIKLEGDSDNDDVFETVDYDGRFKDECTVLFKIFKLLDFELHPEIISVSSKDELKHEMYKHKEMMKSFFRMFRLHDEIIIVGIF